MKSTLVYTLIFWYKLRLWNKK